jgi:hypothetical protein
MLSFGMFVGMFACTPEKIEDTGEDVVDVGPTYCEALALPEQVFLPDSSGSGYGSISGDFTLNTTEGAWTLSDNWTGCDSYLFFNYHPDYDYPAQVWNSDFEDIIQATPRNTHYFFASFNQGQEEIEVLEQQERFDQFVSMLDEDEQDFWMERFHFVTESPWEADGISTFLNGSGIWSFGIMPTQEYAEIGYLALPQGNNWTGSMEGLAFEAEHYNYLMLLEEEIEALNSTVYTSFDGSVVGSGLMDLELPDSSQMSSYDSLHLELNLECGDPYYENCGEWDYLIFAFMCSEETEENSYSDLACQVGVPGEVGLCSINGQVGMCSDGVSEDQASCEMGTCSDGVSEDQAACETEVCSDGISEDQASCEAAEGIWSSYMWTIGAWTETECSVAEDCQELSNDEHDVVGCEGYVEEVPVETLECNCLDPMEETVSATQTCNDEGTGFDDCNCPCNTEIGRWITSYARGGHWLMDASPLLSMMQDGGTRRIRFQSSYGYGNTLNFHLSNQGKEGAAQKAVPLFTGGSFNQDYNSQYEPIDIEIPSDATRVELYAVISGHGWGADIENCAEFCNHTHHFSVNGTEYVKEHPEAGQPRGCIDQISLGTTPNQFGTWPFGRGGWCPGMQVDPWIVDVTESVQKGEINTVTYQGLFNGADYVPESSNSGQGFGANINMQSYLVISR